MISYWHMYFVFYYMFTFMSVQQFYILKLIASNLLTFSINSNNIIYLHSYTESSCEYGNIA